MKAKHVFLMLIIVTTSLMTACTKYEVQSGSVGAIVDITINANDWQYTNYFDGILPYANNYYYATVSVPTLTKDYFNNGQVQGYIVYNKNTDDAFQHLLPYVRHYEEIRDSTWNYYTETVDFVYGIGWVEFNFRSSDFLYEDDVTITPNAMDFRLVLSK